MESHPNSKDFSLTVSVQSADIDEMSHVNNVVYVRWIQEVAAAHWTSITSADVKQRYFWVVLRHEIDYLSAAVQGDTLLVTTWVGETSGARSERFVQIKNKDTSKVLINSKTTWCMLDGRTLKPKRVDEGVIRLLRSN